MITELLIGFIGALVGGTALALAAFTLFIYEQRQKKTQIEKIIGDFKTAILQKSSKGQVSTLYPSKDKIQ
jgi:hypothetical protein